MSRFHGLQKQMKEERFAIKEVTRLKSKASRKKKR